MGYPGCALLHSGVFFRVRWKVRLVYCAPRSLSKSEYALEVEVTTASKVSNTPLPLQAVILIFTLLFWDPLPLYGIICPQTEQCFFIALSCLRVACHSQKPSFVVNYYNEYILFCRVGAFCTRGCFLCFLHSQLCVIWGVKNGFFQHCTWKSSRFVSVSIKCLNPFFNTILFNGYRYIADRYTFNIIYIDNIFKAVI